MQKIFFYLFLITFGTFISAILSFKNVEAIVKPFGIILYGTLFVWIVEILLTKQIKSWRTVYLYGVLFGFIIEAFSYKSIFFGLSREAFVVFDFAVFQAPFLIFVIHPLLSIMAPVYLMKTFFKVPFDLPKLVPTIVPVIGLSVYTFFFAAFFNVSEKILPRFWLSAAIVLIFLTLMQFFGKSKSLGLPDNFRKALGFITVLVYIFTYFTRPVIGGREIMFPNIITLLLAFIFLRFLFFLVKKRTPQNKVVIKEFNPEFSTVRSAIVILVISIISAAAVVLPIHPFIVSISGFIIVTSAIFGTLFFFLAAIGTLVYARRDKQIESKNDIA